MLNWALCEIHFTQVKKLQKSEELLNEKSKMEADAAQIAKLTKESNAFLVKAIEYVGSAE